MSDRGNSGELPGKGRSALDWLRLCFLLREPVGRRDYAIVGFSLMVFKFLVECIVVTAISGQLYTPLDFFNPLISAREKFALGAPDWFGFAWVLWALPFLWISAGMSIRRALDAGVSPWYGLWVLVPFVNLIAMLVLACLPKGTAPAQYWNIEREEWDKRRDADVLDTVLAAIGGIGIGALYAFVLTQVSVYVFHDYGAVLFFGTPFIIGVATGYFLNHGASRTYGLTIVVAGAAVTLAGVALLLFAFEGMICLVMAAPIVLPLGIAGAPIGKWLADRHRRPRRELIGALLILPFCLVVESQLPANHEFVVSSSIDVAASPQTVWQNVIGFSKINEEPEWFFQMGIACPSEARITGAGVGALRECIFTTGKFVEPVTTWDKPRRLAFDVREQPDPMIELTPYRHIHPPHLDLAFRSIRGEFELAALPDGGTRLIGRTWYTLDIRPNAYWTIWSDWLVHRIHVRVLRHIKLLCEEKST